MLMHWLPSPKAILHATMVGVLSTVCAESLKLVQELDL